MTEQYDAGAPDGNTDTKPTDSADQITSQESVQHEQTSQRTHDDGSDHSTTSDASHKKRDEAHRSTEQWNAKPGDSQSAERFQAAAAQVGHDLKSPLSVARLRLDLASQEVNNENLAKVGAALDRMETLIEALQEETATGTEVTEFERILLPELVEQSWQNVAASGATLRNITTLTIQAAPNSLKRVLENLFRNAIEHNGGDVHLEVGDIAESDGFYVADDGTGIAEHVRDAVFESGVSSGCDGSGLGLSIVSQIVEAHDWCIRIAESEAGGARFEISDIKFAAT